MVPDGWQIGSFQWSGVERSSSGGPTPLTEGLPTIVTDS